MNHYHLCKIEKEIITTDIELSKEEFERLNQVINDLPIPKIEIYCKKDFNSKIEFHLCSVNDYDIVFYDKELSEKGFNYLKSLIH